MIWLALTIVTCLWVRAEIRQAQLRRRFSELLGLMEIQEAILSLHQEAARYIGNEINYVKNVIDQIPEEILDEAERLYQDRAGRKLIDG